MTEIQEIGVRSLGLSLSGGAWRFQYRLRMYLRRLGLKAARQHRKQLLRPRLYRVEIH